MSVCGISRMQLAFETTERAWGLKGRYLGIRSGSLNVGRSIHVKGQKNVQAGENEGKPNQCESTGDHSRVGLSQERGWQVERRSSWGLAVCVG